MEANAFLFDVSSMVFLTSPSLTAKMSPDAVRALFVCDRLPNRLKPYDETRAVLSCAAANLRMILCVTPVLKRGLA